MSNSLQACAAGRKRVPCAGQTLDRLVRPMILALLARGACHGYAIARRLGRTPSGAGAAPDVAGVYRLLKLMHRRGQVTSTWETSDSGPARRLYAITPGGRACLGAWVGTLGAYRKHIGSFLRAARHALGAAPVACGRRCAGNRSARRGRRQTGGKLT